MLVCSVVAYKHFLKTEKGTEYNEEKYLSILPSTNHCLSVFPFVKLGINADFVFVCVHMYIV